MEELGFLRCPHKNTSHVSTFKISAYWFGEGASESVKKTSGRVWGKQVRTGGSGKHRREGRGPSGPRCRAARVGQDPPGWGSRCLTQGRRARRGGWGLPKDLPSVRRGGGASRGQPSGAVRGPVSLRRLCGLSRDCYQNPPSCLALPAVMTPDTGRTGREQASL